MAAEAKQTIIEQTCIAPDDCGNREPPCEQPKKSNRSFHIGMTFKIIISTLQHFSQFKNSHLEVIVNQSILFKVGEVSWDDGPVGGLSL